ncbi:MAG: hypothetical protein WCB27_22915 [Thermoguttaceae bacterium]|jgi:hypothetical protein
MKVVTYEGVVENGRIQVLGGVSLPEKAKVYVVLPDVYEVELPPVARIASPRLAYSEQARDLAKEVLDVKEQPDA